MLHSFLYNQAYPLMRQSQQKLSAFLVCWNVKEASKAFFFIFGCISQAILSQIYDVIQSDVT